MAEQLAQERQQHDPTVKRGLDFLAHLFDATAVQPFAVRFWDGTEWRHGKGPPAYTLVLKHPATLRRMFWKPTELSLGEAFIFDDFDIEGDLEASFGLADFLLAHRWSLADRLALGQKLLRMPTRSQPEQGRQEANLSGRAHSRSRDAEAIQYHYNVSNDFYRLWLDRCMVYSCAFFHTPDESLDAAQERKLDYLCRKLRLQPGERLLDIGCGWGGLIRHACRHYGVEAVGITLSDAQAELVRKEIERAGLADRCAVELCDYRDVSEDRSFDKVVSVGMFEHVGEAKLPEYFAKVYRLLRPGGVFLNHGITESAHREKPKGPSFIDKYVFPDGELLPISTSLAIAENAGFEIRDVEGLREHYAMTLRHWISRLEAKRDQAIALTCPVTYRVWRIYMAGSAYGFETGRMGLYQSLLVKSQDGPTDLPLTRCDWYRPCPNGHQE